MNVTPEQHDRTIPQGFVPPRWLTGPKYSKAELIWLCTKLDAANFELRQTLFHLKEELRRMETAK